MPSPRVPQRCKQIGGGKSRRHGNGKLFAVTRKLPAINTPVRHSHADTLLSGEGFRGERRAVFSKPLWRGDHPHVNIRRQRHGNHILWNRFRQTNPGVVPSATISIIRASLAVSMRICG
jgi:hypothetical protein